MKIDLRVILLYLALSAILDASHAATTSAALSLQPGVPVVVHATAAGPVRHAVSDLCRDLNWVLGSESPRLDRMPADPDTPAIVVSCGGTGTESHSISVNGNRVVLHGADTRGTIYAIYSFSDRFLDVPPWWFWAEWKPSRRDSVQVPRDTKLCWSSPQVKWRAWFPNDTDLLTPWIQKDHATRWNLLVETMLRLKLNIIDIGEINEKDLRKLQIPRDRGLALTTTHMAPFGASLRNWDKFWAARGTTPSPALTLQNADALERFWEEHIRLVLSQQVEMLWMVGFRGDGDKGFHKTFPDAPSDAAGRAKVVEAMIKRQVGLLKRVTGEDRPMMRTVLYDECSDYMAAGLLQLPKEPSLIWNFVNARRDHFPASDLRHNRAPQDRLLGYYFNAQFTETGAHLADAEGPWKMEKNFRIASAAGGRFVFSIVNVGNVREFPLTLGAHAQMMWTFDAYGSDRFVEEFCRRYWGADFGPEIARLYRDYFSAYWQQRKPDIPGFERQYIFQDLRLARAARDLLRAHGSEINGQPLLDDRDIGYYRIDPASNGAETKQEAVIAGCGKAAERFHAVAKRCEALAPRLPDSGRRFFEQSLYTQATFMAASSRCAVAAARAAQAVDDPESYRRRIREASRALAETETALGGPPDGPMAGWYATEKIFKLEETKAMIERRLKGFIPAPKSTP